MQWRSLARSPSLPTDSGMDDLQKRFGKLLAAHRRNAELTQAQLAERVGLSVDTIKKLETGSVAPSFRTIRAITQDLNIEPAELFTSQFQGGELQRRALSQITDQLAVLEEDQLKWLHGIINAALEARRRA